MKKNKMKIGIIGHGFVGKATDFGFDRSATKFIVDPIYQTTIDDLKIFNPKIVFVCVPTPMGKDGALDSSIITSVVIELKDKIPNAITVIKSTVLPDILQDLLEINQNIVYNPEFLREKHANEDFINSPMIIFGGNRNTAEKVSDIYVNFSRCVTKEHIFLDIESASLVKYAINTFLACKVIFFNELNELFHSSKSNDTWEKIINVISLDKRIGSSHMSVPGHDGRVGFGGACFPKDSKALLKFSESRKISLETLKSAVKKNNKLRSKYSKLNKREKEQNVKFE